MISSNLIEPIPCVFEVPMILASNIPELEYFSYETHNLELLQGQRVIDIY